MNNKALEAVEELISVNNRLLELCIYALIRDTKIYNHEPCDLIKLKFMDIILHNLNDDTYTLRNKLIEVWESDK